MSKHSIRVHLTDGTVLTSTITNEGLDSVYDALVASSGPHGASVYFQDEDGSLIIMSADKVQYIAATELPEEDDEAES